MKSALQGLGEVAPLPLLLRLGNCMGVLAMRRLGVLHQCVALPWHAFWTPGLGTCFVAEWLLLNGGCGRWRRWGQGRTERHDLLLPVVASAAREGLAEAEG